MSNSVDPDETAHYEPSHLDLCCLQKSILSLMAVKELNFPAVCSADRSICDLVAASSCSSVITDNDQS